MTPESSKEILLNGVGVSSGIAIGKVYRMDQFGLCILKHPIKPDQVEEETERFINALALSTKQLMESREKGIKDLGAQYTYIFNTQMMMIEDSLLRDNTIYCIREQKVNAEWALKLTGEAILAKFSRIKNEYLNERKKDVEQVINLIFRNLMGEMHEPLSNLEEPVIVIAHDITPSDTLRIKNEKVLAFATDAGGKTSHAGILASALDIPAVVGLKNITESARTGQGVIVDSNRGVVILNPGRERFRDYLEREQRFKYFERKLLKTRDQKAVTSDGHHIRLMANIEYADELQTAFQYGAQGVGLYRTEYLFIDRKGHPSETEQFDDYKKIAEQTRSHYAIIRTLDLGGDKVFSNDDAIKETNPALGLRGIRFCLNNRSVFQNQLKAILRASHYGNLKIMYPMISDVGEIKLARDVLHETMHELDREGIPYDKDIQIGAMIETPAAALAAGILAEEVDFFSIGTNDLIQYLLAVDRDNEQVAHIYQPFHPAVLYTIKTILSVSESAGIPVGICGMMGGDPFSMAILLGLGKIDAVSMDPHSIPIIKKLICAISYSDAIALSNEALQLKDSAVIHDMVSNKFREWGLDRELFFER